MKGKHKLSSKIISLLLFTFTLLFSTATSAKPIVVTDILNRRVTVNVPVNKVILGEGRMLYLVAMLDKENPAKRIVAMGNDLQTSDPATWRQYSQHFPQLKNIPTFSGTEKRSLNIEHALALQPDVIIMNIEAKTAIEEQGHDKALQKAGIPVIYVDFRYNPSNNTLLTMRLFGALWGEEKIAEQFIEFREQQLKRVSDVLAKNTPKKPRVFIERIGGYTDECCLTFGDGNFGRFVSLAGGDNIGAKNAPNTFYMMNPEQVLVADPDKIVITSANFSKFMPEGDWIGLGPNEDLNAAKIKLEKYLKKPAYTGSNAVKNQQFYAIWHQFYNSPYDFIAIQQLAHWIHPEIFADLNADDTFKIFYEKFLSIPYEPGYFVSLENK
ncbi:TPA: ABC transporter substrate-binding protein [Providencia stuartii]|uniref:ABC transporter substrate-binding protein n=1 Tax=Providencia manganoxydans TaxID=2923283 RepID=UPI002853E6E9|nr:ABC transporter substrate-binding protein [Providencia manganoxydans]MDX4946949.1 ABC transporter substrate-binding protein [Providencia manganoxydans]HEF8772689.1 ABC transporter substrate-binding protein [Providencia stuartii]